MKQYFVYLKCSDNSYYTGITSDLEGRLVKHQSIILKAIPIQKTNRISFYTEFNDVEQTISFEKRVKGWSRKKRSHY